MDTRSGDATLRAADHLALDRDGGEQLRFLGDSTMRLKITGAETGGALGFYEYVSGPGTKAAPQHVHHGHDESFYVVDGHYDFLVGTTTFAAGAGAFIYVPRGTPHGFFNSGAERGRIVGTFTPARFADYFRELADLMDGTGAPPDHDAWAELYGRYDTTFADG
jgi:mannose-6-phosphate isomerase-like protein (cupin superfamily)